MNNEEEINKLKDQITSHEAEIQKHKRDIYNLKEKIFELQGKTEVCFNCWGAGRAVIGHSFRDGTIYGGVCYVCGGCGRLTKEKYELMKEQKRDFRG